MSAEEEGTRQPEPVPAQRHPRHAAASVDGILSSGREETILACSVDGMPLMRSTSAAGGPFWESGSVQEANYNEGREDKSLIQLMEHERLLRARLCGASTVNRRGSVARGLEVQRAFITVPAGSWLGGTGQHWPLQSHLSGLTSGGCGAEQESAQSSGKGHCFSDAWFRAPHVPSVQSGDSG